MHLSELCTKVLLFFEIPKSFVEKNKFIAFFSPKFCICQTFFVILQAKTRLFSQAING